MDNVVHFWPGEGLDDAHSVATTILCLVSGALGLQ
jgi:hypothetical protein